MNIALQESQDDNILSFFPVGQTAYVDPGFNPQKHQKILQNVHSVRLSEKSFMIYSYHIFTKR